MGLNNITFKYGCYFRDVLVVTLLLLNLFNADLLAASNGKLGTTSSASVEISVTVPQVFEAISPSKILLNKFNDKAFCVGHHGFSQNANVPYSLVIDDILTSGQQQSSKNHSFPYSIYLHNSNASTSKQMLKPGMSIALDSSLSVNKNFASECLEGGLTFSLTENNATQVATNSDNTLGLLVLLVSPE